jgi:hypothetical protein
MFASLQQPCMVLWTWIWLHWPLSVVSLRKEASDDEPDGLKHADGSVINYSKYSDFIRW